MFCPYMYTYISKMLLNITVYYGKYAALQMAFYGGEWFTHFFKFYLFEEDEGARTERQREGEMQTPH